MMTVSQPITRRRLLSSGVAAVAAAAAGGGILDLLAACSQGRPSEQASLAVEIDEGQNANPWQWFGTDIKSKYGLSLSVKGLPFVGQYEKIVSELVTKSNAWDILVFPPQMMGDFVAKGFLRPLDDYGDIKQFKLDDVLPVYREPASKRNGKWYSAMYDGDTLMLSYRKDLFQQAGIASPPATWDEFMAVAKELHRPPTQYGTAFYAQRGDCYAWFVNIFAGLGGRYFDSSMNPTIASDQGVRALEMLVQMKQYAPPNILQIDYPGLNQVYLNGSTAMVIQWDDLPLKAEDPTQSKVVGRSGYAACPVRTYEPYSRVMAISAYSSSPHNAWKVIQYMNSSAVSIRDVYDPKCGEDPFRFSHFDPAAVKGHAGDVLFSSAQATEYVSGIKACLANGYPELSIPGAPRYLDTLDQRVNQALAGQLTATQALQQAVSDWNQITQSQGRDNQVKAYDDWVKSFKTAGVSY